MIQLRELPTLILDDVTALDVAESGAQRYRVVDGQLQIFEQTWQRPFWDRDHWTQILAKWTTKLKPDCYVGAYAGATLVGLAGLRERLTPTMAQLTSLYIDRQHRQQGIASQLVQAVFHLSAASGAQAIYVSAKPSIPAVGFYTRHGFRVTAHPDPDLFALEPLDIHMVRPITLADHKESS